MAQQGNPTQMMLSAMQALTDQLRSLQEYLGTQEAKQEKLEVLREQMPEPNFRQAPYEQGPLFTERGKPFRYTGEAPRRKRKVAEGQQRLDVEGATPYAPDGDPEGGRVEEQEAGPFDAGGKESDTDTGFKTTFKRMRDEKASFTKSLLGSIRSYGPKGDATGENQPSPDDLAPHGMFGGPEDQAAITWAIAGEHGGPQALRNLYLQKYNVDRSLKWAQRAAATDGMAEWAGKLPEGKMRDIATGGIEGMQSAANFAYENKAPLFAAYMGAKGVHGLFGHINQQLTADEEFGQRLGYHGIGTPSIFGMRDPLVGLSTAASVGSAGQLESQQLMGRIPGAGFFSGVSSEQAKADVQGLASQGWHENPQPTYSTFLGSLPGIGHPLQNLTASIFGDKPSGDITQIAEKFERPLQERFGKGFTNADAEQFTPYFRHAQTSLQQLTDELGNLGDAALATHETTGQLATSIKEAGNQFEQMGSSGPGGAALASGFNAVTAIDPRMAGQQAQSPLFQGMALAKYGVLPSGIGDMAPGAFTNTSLATLQMLQHATSGFAKDKYEMVNGERVKVQSGNRAQLDQIAQMSGMPEWYVQRMLGDQGPIQGRNKVMTSLGSAQQGTGIWDFINRPGQGGAEGRRRWQNTIDPYLKGAGLSTKEIHDLDSTGDMRKRANDLKSLLTKKGGTDPYNQIQDKPNTITLQLTGQAAKMFQFSSGGATYQKQMANAGNGMYAGTANSTTGDLSNQSSSDGLTPPTAPYGSGI